MRKEGQVIDAEVIPAVEAGITLTEGHNSQKQTVDEEHRAKNSGRKGQGRDESARARRKIRRHH
jgi:hypothetical protein